METYEEMCCMYFSSRNFQKQRPTNIEESDLLLKKEISKIEILLQKGFYVLSKC
jgi:hypothetical protein